MQPFDPKRARVWFIIGLLIPFFVISFGTVHAGVDVDTWWHLAVGKWVMEHQAVPWVDPFSSYGINTGKTWIAYSWLYEVLLYFCYLMMGESGIVFFRVSLALTTMLVALLVVRQLVHHPGWCLLISVLAFLSLVPTVIMERPWNFTVLFCWLTCLVVRERQMGKSSYWHWLLLVAYFIWANLHIQFIYGLAILGVASVSSFFGNSVQLRKQIWLIAFLCFLATLVNPYHAWLYWVVWDYATQPAAFQLITELKPPRLDDSYQWFVLAMALGSLIILIRLWVRRKEQHQQDRSALFFVTLLWVMACVLGLRAIRDLWFVMLVVCVILAYLASLMNSEVKEHSPANPWRSLLAISLVTALLASRFITPDKFRARLAQQYPLLAVEHCKAKHLPGPLLNSFDWGGYLIWHLPEHPVAIDGRTNLHGDVRLKQFYQTMFQPTDPITLAEFKECNLIIMERKLPFTDYLQKAAEWKVEYEDERAVVFVRR